MKHVCMFFIRLYRRYVSPIKPKCCRFTPTCSAYALEAYEKRGFFVGTALTVWRLLRCNPFCRPGHDPVPERKRKVKRVPITNMKTGNEDNN
ncbi:MAG: membrane protein insertion efficiency factor YidD [Clostridia bacterium]|nr:membrane protein insertion efficiency factor YidD [Clostridia bacterium]